jgi:hypothetical protein
MLLHASATKNQSMAQGKGTLGGWSACMQKKYKIDDTSHMQHLLKLKKSINDKPNIKIKF